MGNKQHSTVSPTCPCLLYILRFNQLRTKNIKKKSQELNKAKLEFATLTSIYKAFTLHCASLVVQLVKNLPAIGETWVGIPGLGRSPGEGNGYPLQYSGLENSMDCCIRLHRDTTERLSLHCIRYYKQSTDDLNYWRGCHFM